MSEPDSDIESWAAPVGLAIEPESRAAVAENLAGLLTVAPVPDLPSKQTKLSLGLLGLDQPIQRRRLALSRDVVPAYADASQKRPDKGLFVEGNPGGPGRPPGSKNIFPRGA